MSESNDDRLGLSDAEWATFTEYLAFYVRARYSGQADAADIADDNAPSNADSADAEEAPNAVVRAAFGKALDQFIQDMLTNLRQNMPQMLADRRAEQVGFEARLYARWRPALDLFEAILVMTQEAGDSFNRKHRAQAAQDNDLVFEALVRLHARACLTCAEVLALLRGGYASGANARWRTLHEISVVAFFISEHGQDVAERYLLHHIVESAKSADEYQKHCARLGYTPYSATEMAEFHANADALCQRFGKEYRKHYGWAAKALGKADPTFVDIEKAISLQHWRPFYGMASHGVHAKPKGIMFDLGNIMPAEMMLAGPSNSGLADPGQSALISLAQITTVALTLKPDVYEIVTLRAMEAFVEEAGQRFVEIQHQIEADEQKARELRDSPTMAPEELATIRLRWDEPSPAIPQLENGYALAHAPDDIRRLLAEIERLNSLFEES